MDTDKNINEIPDVGENPTPGISPLIITVQGAQKQLDSLTKQGRWPAQNTSLVSDRVFYRNCPDQVIIPCSQYAKLNINPSPKSQSSIRQSKNTKIKPLIRVRIRVMVSVWVRVRVRIRVKAWIKIYICDAENTELLTPILANIFQSSIQGRILDFRKLGQG